MSILLFYVIIVIEIRKSTGDTMAKIKEWLEEDKLILIQGWARDGLTNEQIAHNMGIGRTTLFEWCKKEPNIADALKQGKEYVDYQVENALLMNALSGNVVAQIFWLKNRKKLQWRDKIEYTADNTELTKVEQLLAKIENEAKDDTK